MKLDLINGGELRTNADDLNIWVRIIGKEVVISVEAGNVFFFDDEDSPRWLQTLKSLCIRSSRQLLRKLRSPLGKPAEFACLLAQINFFCLSTPVDCPYKTKRGSHGCIASPIFRCSTFCG